jgi:hypothetical protein
LAGENPIPDFNEHGTLPVGIYRCEPTHIKTRLVDPFRESRTRPKVFSGFQEWRRDALESRVEGAIQWVDGSFVEAKTDPNDIDVLTLMHHETLNKLPVRAKTFIREWLSKPRSQDRYLVDSSFYATYEPCHEKYEVWKNKRRIYKKLYGHTRGTLTGKGFLQVTLGECPEKLAELVEQE